MFESISFDLHAYLERIGHRGEGAPTLAVLAEVAARHPAALPFENLTPLLRRPVALDIGALQEKLVHGGRGGYCFEHNLLLGHALVALGFPLTALAARVLWNAPPGTDTPRSHMLLVTSIESTRYLVDAGFGGLTLTAPLVLEPGLEQQTPHERFRLLSARGGFVLEAHVAGAWKALYRFDLQPQLLQDFEVANWYVSTHPRSHFVTSLMAGRAAADRRYALRNNQFAVHHRDGRSERTMLQSAAELREVLCRQFRIRVPEGPDMDAVFERLTSLS